MTTGPIIRQIQELVARVYDVDRAALLSHQRTKNLAMARGVAIYISRMVTDMSLPELGAVFDRDHTTVLSAVRRITKRRISDSYLDATINGIMKELMQGDAVSSVPVLLHVPAAEIKKLDELIGRFGEDRQEVAQTLLSRTVKRFK